MKIVVDDKCTNKEHFESCSKFLSDFLMQHIRSYSTSSLKYFVIADSDSDKFHNTVKYYAEQLNTECHVNDTEMYQVAGKSLEGIDNDGVYSQVIVVKSFLVLGMLSDLINLEKFLNGESIEDSNVQWIGLMTILHELGHAIDNEIIYNQTETVNLRVFFDLSKKEDYDEYFKKQAISLWSEFFAESFVFNSCPLLRRMKTYKNDEVLNCIKNYRGEGITPDARAHRILYLFIHVIAHNKGVGFDYSVFDGYKQYIDIFKEVERILFDLLDKYPNINVSNDFSDLSKVFEKLCVYVQRYGF